MDGFNGLVNDIESAGRGTKRYGSQFGQREVLENVNFKDGNVLRARLSGKGGSSFSKWAAEGMKTAMRAFELQFFRDGPNPFGPAAHEAEDAIPRIILFGRRYAALNSMLHSGGADLGPPGEHELAMVYRSARSADRDKEDGEGEILALGEESDVHGRRMPMTPGFYMQGSPCLAAGLTQLNYALADLQYQWACEDYDSYLRVRPCHIIHGYPSAIDRTLRFGQQLKGFVDHLGWSIDGGVLATAGDDGSAPLRMNSTARDVHLGSGLAVKTVHATVAAKGRFDMYDYALGAGVTEGARCYLRLGKYPWANYTRRDSNKALVYNLIHRASDEDRDAAGMVRTIPGIIRGGKGDGKVFCPFQFMMIFDPSGGGSLDRLKYGSFMDEDGDHWADAWVGLVGKVLTAPIRPKFSDPPEPEELRPIMDGRNYMARDTIDMILFPDDGVFAL
jgi:hypothetical protein